MEITRENIVREGIAREEIAIFLLPTCIVIYLLFRLVWLVRWFSRVVPFIVASLPLLGQGPFSCCLIEEALQGSIARMKR